VIEKVIATQLLMHMSNNNILDKMQSAYKRYHSTETALLSVQNDILRFIDDGKHVLLVLLDLSAAFDTVNHSILLSFLENHVGVTGSALNMFRSYFMDRTQCVSIKNILSSVTDLTQGVPQGSVLGPILFCTYMLPLGVILQKHKLNYHIYADDTQLYCSSNTESSFDSLNSIEKCAKDIEFWMIKNKLKLNGNKTEFLILSSSRSHACRDVHLKMGDATITPSSSCRNLGVIFDSHIDMNSQISSICRSTHYHLRNIGRIRSLLPDSAAAQLIHSLVTSRLDYCNSLLYGLPDSKLSRLQRIQNIGARILSRSPKSDHVTPILKQLHWLPIKFRILFKILLITYRCLHNLAPEYITDLISIYTPSRSLRSSDLQLLAVPKTRLKSYGDRCFAAAAPREWNKLPLYIRQSTSLSCFKSQLKSYFFKQHFD
jgi:hypothetical protein